MRRKKLNLLVLICSILFSLGVSLCGCGKKVVEEQLTEKPKKELKQVEILTKEWKGFSKVEGEDTSWTVTGFEDDLCGMDIVDYAMGISLTVTREQEFFRLQQLEDYDTRTFDSLVFHRVNFQTGEKEQILFTFGDLKCPGQAEKDICEELARRMEDGKCGILAFDMRADKAQVFISYYLEEKLEGHLYWLEIDHDLNVCKMVDIAESMWGEECNEEDWCDEISIVCDEQETCYLINHSRMEITVVNSNGKTQDKITLPQGPDNCLLYAGKAEGIPVYCFQHDKKTGFFVVTDGEAVYLYEGDFVEMEKCFLDSYGNILYLNKNLIYRWNVIEGSCEKIYNISNFQWYYSLAAIIGDAQNDIRVMGLTMPGYQMYCLSEKADFETVEINFLLHLRDNYLEDCTAAYNRSHPGIQIQLSYVENGLDEYELQRIMEKMKAGEGPDLLFIDWEPMEALMHAGCLQPIDQVITEDIRQNVFPGVLEIGEIDGELYGAVFGAGLETLYVADSTWTSDHWTLQEFMDCFNNAKKNGKIKSVDRANYQRDGADLFGSMSRVGMDNLNFIDVKNKKSHFDSDLFLQYMEFCHENEEVKNKAYGVHFSTEEMIKQIKEGEAFSYTVEGPWWSFFETMTKFGEGYHSVGYPDNTGEGVYLACYRGTAVSKWTEHLDVVTDFLRFMYSEKMQANYNSEWIRRDCFEKRMKNPNPDIEEFHFCSDIGITSYGRYGKIADGSSYVKEYIELMNKAKPEGREKTVQKMIWEEIPAYYNGDKSAKEVAGILHSRVQLYLDEQ